MKTTSDSKLKLLRVIVLVLAVGAYVGVGQESGRWNPGYLCAFHAIGLVLVFTIHHRTLDLLALLLGGLAGLLAFVLPERNLAYAIGIVGAVATVLWVHPWIWAGLRGRHRKDALAGE